MTAATARQDGTASHQTEPLTAALVVGLGNTDRGDDGVGPAVARGITTLRLPAVEVLVHEDPTDLIELWSGRSLAVVVDALCSGAPAGTVSVLRTGVDGERLPDAAWAATGRGGTHAFGLATAVELARALRRLPDRLVVVGVEAAAFDDGAPLSPAVEAAVPEAVAAIVGVLGRGVRRGAGDVSR
jgi:hydrogenase maturation protease